MKKASKLSDLMAHGPKRIRKSRVTVYLLADLLAEVKAVCKARGIPLSELLNVLMADFIVTHGDKALSGRRKKRG